MRRQSDHSLEVRAEINVTSLVDVAFTLLIIFIITAPILQGGIEVAVPQGRVQALQADEHTLIVSVNRDGSIFLGESEVVDRETFASAFGQLMASTQPERVWIKSDSTTTWAATFDVISTVAATGVNYAIVGEERPGGR
jgi:biopolymer transport protein TolR